MKGQLITIIIIAQSTYENRWTRLKENDSELTQFDLVKSLPRVNK